MLYSGHALVLVALSLAPTRVESSPQAGFADAQTLKHVEGWVAAMRGVNGFYAAATLTESDTLFKREAKFTAEIWLQKPDLARLDVVKVSPTADASAADMTKVYFVNGRTLYEYDGVAKTRTTVPLEPGSSSILYLFDFLFGLSVERMAERFAVRTLKEDKNYLYLELTPLRPSDWNEKLTVVLCAPKFQQRAYIPRRVVLTKQDGRTETWDFPDPKVNPDGITEKTFKLIDMKELPGWAERKWEWPPSAPKVPSAAPTETINPCPLLPWSAQLPCESSIGGATSGSHSQPNCFAPVWKMSRRQVGRTRLCQ
jgi:TIGR03009 family protein